MHLTKLYLQNRKNPIKNSSKRKKTQFILRTSAKTFNNINFIKMEITSLKRAEVFSTVPISSELMKKTRLAEKLYLQ